jgi:hypothetical protein
MFESFLDDLQKSNPHIQVLTYAADIKNEEIKLFDHKGQEHASSKKDFKDGGICDPKSPYNPSGGLTTFQQAKAAGESIAIQSLDFHND